MSSWVSQLSEGERKELFEALNYLNMAEITALCKARGIPFMIFVEDPSGKLIQSREKDRKGVVLARVKHYLKTGKILDPTIFQRSVVKLDQKLDKPKATDRIFYDLYDKKNRALMDLLKKLTDGEYKDGAIARILLREFWASGKAPTIEEFASAWENAKANHDAPNEEWAFLSDRSKGLDTTHWKALRVQKAKFAQKIFQKIFLKRENA